MDQPACTIWMQAGRVVKKLKDRKSEILREFLLQKNAVEILNGFVKSGELKKDDVYQLIFHRETNCFSLKELRFLIHAVKEENEGVPDWELSFKIKEIVQGCDTLCLEIDTGTLLEYSEFLMEELDMDQANRYADAILEKGYQTAVFLKITDPNKMEIKGDSIIVDPACCDVLFGKEYLYAYQKLVENKMVSGDGKQICICNRCI